MKLKKASELVAYTLKQQYEMDSGLVDAREYIHHLAVLIGAMLQAIEGDLNVDKFVGDIIGDQRPRRERLADRKPNPSTCERCEKHLKGYTERCDIVFSSRRWTQFLCQECFDTVLRAFLGQTK